MGPDREVSRRSGGVLGASRGPTPPRAGRMRGQRGCLPPDASWAAGSPCPRRLVARLRAGGQAQGTGLGAPGAGRHRCALSSPLLFTALESRSYSQVHFSVSHLPGFQIY